MQYVPNYALKKSRDIGEFISFRHSTPFDDKEIAELLVQSFNTKYRQKLPTAILNHDGEADLRNVAWRREHGETFVIEIGFQIIGTCTLIYPGPAVCEAWIPGAANLRCLAIHPKYQGLGFAENLLTAAHRSAREKNIEQVCLHVVKGALGVASIYERYGYQYDSRGDHQRNGQALAGYRYDFNKIHS